MSINLNMKQFIWPVILIIIGFLKHVPMIIAGEKILIKTQSTNEFLHLFFIPGWIILIVAIWFIERKKLGE